MKFEYLIVMLVSISFTSAYKSHYKLKIKNKHRFKHMSSIYSLDDRGSVSIQEVTSLMLGPFIFGRKYPFQA